MSPIQPRTIQPGFLWRWTKTGLSLLGVNFHLWFAFSLLFCGVCYVGYSEYRVETLIQQA